jgi:hypothetical protein
MLQLFETGEAAIYMYQWRPLPKILGGGQDQRMSNMYLTFSKT